MEKEQTLPQLHIELLKEGERYYPAFKGSYTEPNGKSYLMENPEGITIYNLRRLDNPKDRFDFFCYAYMQSIIKDIWPGRNDKLVAQWKEFRERFGDPWYSGTRHTLPSLRELFLNDMVGMNKDETLNIEILEKAYNELASFKFVLYPPYNEID